MRDIRLCLGAGGLFATGYLCFDAPMIVGQSFGGLAASTSFFIPALAGAALCGLAEVLRSFSHDRVQRSGCNIGSLVAMLAIAGGFMVNRVSLPPLILVIFGMMFGLGCGMAFLRWSAAMAGLSSRFMVIRLAAASAVAALLNLVSLALSLLTAEGPLLVLLVAIGFTLPSPPAKEGLASVALPFGDVLAKSKTAVARDWKCGTPFLLSLFILASTSCAQTTGEVISNYPTTEGTWSNGLGVLLASVLLLGIAKGASDRAYSMAEQTVPLVCVAMLLLVWFMGNSSGTVGQFLFSGPLGMTLAMAAILFWANLVSEQEEFSTGVLFGSALFGCCAFFLLVFLLWSIAGDTVMNLIDLCLMVLYLAGVGGEALLRQVNSGEKEEQEDRHDDLTALMDERCEELAMMAQLSKRETEILGYLVQGRSAPYIAEELFLSVNTVKTHIKRIYAKIGVHSREGLIDKVHGQ